MSPLASLIYCTMPLFSKVERDENGLWGHRHSQVSLHAAMSSGDGKLFGFDIRGAAVKESTLAVIVDAEGNRFRICEGYVKYYAFRMAVLRFAVTSEDENILSCKNVLTVQDAILRIGHDLLPNPYGKRKSGLTLVNVKTGASFGDFSTASFVKGILDRFVGKSAGTEVFDDAGQSFNPPKIVSAEEARWRQTKHSDRLFTFTMVSVGQVPKELQKRVVYHFGMFEPSLSIRISDAQIEKFYSDEGKVNSKHKTETGGIVHTFHRDGGTTIYFGEEPAYPDIPFNIVSRLKNGTDKSLHYGRPLSAFALCETIMVKRTFLNIIELQLKDLVAKSATQRDSEVVHELQKTYAEALWYRIHCGGNTQVSTSNAISANFKMWSKTMELEEKEEQVITMVKDLHQLLQDVVAKQSQHRIDALALVLASVGISGIANDVIANFYGADGDGTMQAKLIYIPGIVLFVMLLIGIAFVQLLGLRRVVSKKKYM